MLNKSKFLILNQSSCKVVVFGLPDRAESPAAGLWLQSTALHLLHAAVSIKYFKSQNYYFNLLHAAVSIKSLRFKHII